MSKNNLYDELINSDEAFLDDYIVFSGNVYTFESALNEVLALQSGAQLVKWLSPQTAIIFLPEKTEAFCIAIKKYPPIYIQHISPIQHVFLIENIEELINKIDGMDFDFSGKPFSVQTTIFSRDARMTASDISKKISEIFIKRGETQDTKNPYHVITVSVFDGHIFCGVSNVKNNLSKWACGKAYYKKELNRAEYKLTECAEYFNLDFRGGTALDIGAAPGGWTKAMSDLGYRVTAVDPAELDCDIASISTVSHKKTTIQKFLEDNNVIFDVIVNDMIADCRESARVMISASRFLASGGYAVMTAKLPQKGYNPRLKTAVKILEEKYRIIGEKQLPSNKSEVTIAMMIKNQ